MQKKCFLISRVFIAFLVLLAVTYAQNLKAQSSELTPKLIIGYNYNNNVDAIDEDETNIEPTEQAWVNYILGIEAKARQARTEEGISASIGYSQYVDSRGDLEEIADTSPNNYDFFRAQGEAWFKYLGRRVSFDVIDRLVRTRSLEDLYGPGTSEISYRYLYTDNLASAMLRLQPSPKTRILLSASYETLTFERAENEYLEDTEPSNSSETRGYIRLEYNFTPKTYVFVDAQGGQRIIDERTVVLVRDPMTGLPLITQEVEVADYNFYQGVLGLKHSFSERTSLTVSGGAHAKDFFDLGPIFELEDFTVPIGRIIFTQMQEKRYRLDLIGEAGSSTYGMDLFFNYVAGTLAFKYFFTERIWVSLHGTYKQDTYELDINDRELVWAEDRIDELVYYGASFDWEILQKNNNTWLSFQAFYSHRTRNSSIDGVDDYAAAYVGPDPNNPLNPIIAYDTEIDFYGVMISFMPTMLIGN